MFCCKIHKLYVHFDFSHVKHLRLTLIKKRTQFLIRHELYTYAVSISALDVISPKFDLI